MKIQFSRLFQLLALSMALFGTRLVFAHAGHGEPHGTDAHASDFMSYVIGFITAAAWVKFGSMGIAQYIKGHLSQARAWVLASLCTATAFVFVYWFTQV